MPEDPKPPEAPTPPAPTPPPPPPPDPKVAALEARLAESQNQIQLTIAEKKAIEQRSSEAADQLKQRILRSEFKTEAVRAGIIDPNLIQHLPIDGASIDEAGNVTGMDKVIEATKAKHPVLFKTPPTPIGDVPPAPPQGTELPKPATLRGLPQKDVDSMINDARERLRSA